MSKIPDFVQGMDMPAMKKKGGGVMDLMRPGNGTPWEDRGSTGAVGAYVKTVIKSLTSPALLMDHIRRPETTTDSASFAMTSGAMWILGVVIYNIVWLYWILPGGNTAYDKDSVDTLYYFLSVAVQCVIVGAGFFCFLRFGPKIYRSLGGNELKGAQPSLISNCFNYSMGPSILAVIPYFGWGLAVLWILIDLMAAGKRRLFMKSSGAIINVMIVAFIALAVAIIPVLLLHFVWGSLLEMNGLSAKPAPPPPKILPAA